MFTSEAMGAETPQKVEYFSISIKVKQQEIEDIAGENKRSRMVKIEQSMAKQLKAKRPKRAT